MISESLIDSFVNELRSNYDIIMPRTRVTLSTCYWVLKIKRRKAFSPSFYFFFPIDDISSIDSIQYEVSKFNTQYNNRKPMICVFFDDKIVKGPNLALFNGICFVHFVFFNEETKSVLFDQSFRYFMVSDIYRAIHVFSVLLENRQ